MTLRCSIETDCTGPLGGPPWWAVIPMVFVTPLATFYLNRQWVFA